MAETTTTTTAPAPKKKRSISTDLTAKFGGAKAGEAQAALSGINTQLADTQRLGQDLVAQQQGLGDDATEQQRKDIQNQIVANQQSTSGLQSQAAQQSAIVANPLSRVDAKTRDIISGASFGETVLGEEGLGRAGDNADIQSGMAALREQAQGFSGAEATARREQAMGGIATNTQGMSRAMQAQLARSGVTGGAAGKALLGVAQQGQQAQANAEQQLFIQGEEARRSGTDRLMGAAGELSKFDLGQAAKEKNIVLQSGLGFAQLGAAERGAKLQADASKAAAASQAAASCHTGDAELKMADGTFKRIDQIKIGEELELGGRVKMIGSGEADAHIYKLGDELVTATHLIEFQGRFHTVSSLGFERTNLPTNTIIYPIVTERGYYITKSGILHGDLLTEEHSEGLNWSVRVKSTLG